jgi:hypothetical protein
MFWGGKSSSGLCNLSEYTALVDCAEAENADSLDVVRLALERGRATSQIERQRKQNWVYKVDSRQCHIPIERVTGATQ